jgi:hypothetical protein
MQQRLLSVECERRASSVGHYCGVQEAATLNHLSTADDVECPEARSETAAASQTFEIIRSISGRERMTNGPVKDCVSVHQKIPNAPTGSLRALPIMAGSSAWFSDTAQRCAPTPAQMFVKSLELNTYSFIDVQPFRSIRVQSTLSFARRRFITNSGTSSGTRWP